MKGGDDAKDLLVDRNIGSKKSRQEKSTGGSPYVSGKTVQPPSISLTQIAQSTYLSQNLPMSI